jgi:hypothetical protein
MTMNIIRDIDPELIEWKESRSRRPLLVRGARQVGKTYSIIEFAKVAFENHVAVNFEERPEFSMCIQSLDVKEIMGKISILSWGRTTCTSGFKERWIGIYRYALVYLVPKAKDSYLAGEIF